MKNVMFSFFVNVNNKFSDEFMSGVNVVRHIQETWCINNNIDYINADSRASEIWEELKKTNNNWTKVSFISVSDYIRTKITLELFLKYDNVCYIDSDILLYKNFDILPYFTLTDDNKKMSIYREYWLNDIDTYLLLGGDPMDYSKESPTDETHKNYRSYVDLDTVKLNNGLMIFNNNENHKNILNQWASFGKAQIESKFEDVSSDFTFIGVKYCTDMFTDMSKLNIMYNGNMMSVHNEFHIQHNTHQANIFFSVLDAILKDRHNADSMFMNLSTLSVMSSWMGVINTIHEHKGVYSYTPTDTITTCNNLDKVFEIRDQVEKSWKKDGFLNELRIHKNHLWNRNINNIVQI